LGSFIPVHPAPEQGRDWEFRHYQGREFMDREAWHQDKVYLYQGKVSPHQDRTSSNQDSLFQVKLLA
jgi:hypothetical protein